jgi:hypothetical protein
MVWRSLSRFADGSSVASTEPFWQIATSVFTLQEKAMRHALFASLTFIATLIASFGAVAGHHLESEKTSISKLSWMTGSWSGDIGGPVLEENWTEAKAGSIAALVRITSPESTAMIGIVDIQ